MAPAYVCVRISVCMRARVYAFVCAESSWLWDGLTAGVRVRFHTTVSQGIIGMIGVCIRAFCT